jgi:hypothetical protein
MDKSSYHQVARDFHRYHRHDGNVAMHLATTTLGLWGAVQLALTLFPTTMTAERDNVLAFTTVGGIGPLLVASYGAFVAMTTPRSVAALHSVVLVMMCLLRASSVLNGMQSALPSLQQKSWLLSLLSSVTDVHLCVAAIVLGYGLQDLAHYVCAEPTFLNSYIATQPGMLALHTVWLLPLVLDACAIRNWFVPHLLVPRKRTFRLESVASTSSVDFLRAWIATHVPETPETTHLWPHRIPETSEPVRALENDAAIMAGFRTVFSPAEYDVVPVVEMNEIYVTAVGSKSEINSDAVFYTPHVDGPYWFFPFGASLYRVLVAVTPNRVVRTRFSLQHPGSTDSVLDMHGVLGFDYNRELHWIDHVPNQKNDERRSLIKLHYCVYPKGWKSYGRLVSAWNSQYNTWARNNFLRTLRPTTMYEYGMAWWIWLTTWANALLEEHVGWTNVVYVVTAYLLSSFWALHQPWIFVVLTSFRHYAMYVATFAFRDNVAHGVLMRDAKLYKTLSMLNLARLLLPVVEVPRDIPALALASCGFALTLLATFRLGMVRTYFGTELGLVPPRYVTAFPYGTVPHPMIGGQIIGLSVILFSLYGRLTAPLVALLVAHIGSYAAHMVQEILTSAY